MATMLTAVDMEQFEDLPAFETFATRFAAFCVGVPLAVTCIVLASIYVSLGGATENAVRCAHDGARATQRGAGTRQLVSRSDTQHRVMLMLSSSDMMS